MCIQSMQKKLQRGTDIVSFTGLAPTQILPALPADEDNIRGQPSRTYQIPEGEMLWGGAQSVSQSLDSSDQIQEIFEWSTYKVQFLGFTESINCVKR